MLRSTLALVCTFLLIGCSPRRDSDQPETNARGDQGRHNSSEVQKSKRKVAVEELKWDCMQSRLGAGGNEGRLIPIRTLADYQDFALAMSVDEDGHLDLSEHFPQPPSFDPAAQVLIFIELPNGAGSELRPNVKGMIRTRGLVRVLVYYTDNPRGLHDRRRLALLDPDSRAQSGARGRSRAEARARQGRALSS